MPRFLRDRLPGQPVKRAWPAKSWPPATRSAPHTFHPRPSPAPPPGVAARHRADPDQQRGRPRQPVAGPVPGAPRPTRRRPDGGHRPRTSRVTSHRCGRLTWWRWRTSPPKDWQRPGVAANPRRDAAQAAGPAAVVMMHDPGGGPVRRRLARLDGAHPAGCRPRDTSSSRSSVQVFCAAFAMCGGSRPLQPGTVGLSRGRSR